MTTKSEYDKAYYEANKDKRKEWYLNNKDKEIERSKQYYLENKESRLEYNKQWRKDNKEKFDEIIKCECGGKYVIRNKTRHLKTTRHIRYLGGKINITLE